MNDEKRQLPNGIWVIRRGNNDWDNEVNENFEVLDRINGEIQGLKKEYRELKEKIENINPIEDFKLNEILKE